MPDSSEIGELAKQLLQKWQLPEELIEFAGLLGTSSHVVSSQARKLEVAVNGVLNSFSHIQQDNLRLPQKFDIDATLFALAFHYAKLRQLLVQGEANRETLVTLTRKNVFPLIKELGMWDFKRELEDTLLQLVAQEQYQEVNSWLLGFQGRHRELWSSLLDTIQSQSEKVVKGCEVKVVYCGVEGARRRLVKLGGYDRARMQNFARIYLTVPRLVDCYAALAVVHAVGLPEPYSFRDMITTPQSNGYSGLLTSICVNYEHARGEQPRQVFDIIILTHLMEQIAHRGVTYPSCYQTIRSNSPLADLDGEARCIHCLVQNLTSGHTDRAAMITVFTAKGEAKELRNGSTVLDLAYKLHTAIGNHAESAEINGKWVPLNTKLKNGDSVRINRLEHQGARSEVDLQYAFEPLTKQMISRFLNKEPVRKGRHLLATYLRNRNAQIEDEHLDGEVLAVCQNLGLDDPNELYRAIAEKREIPGHPHATPGLVGALIIQRRQLAMPEVPILTSVSPTTDWVPSLGESDYIDPLPFRLCGLCRPNPMNQIVAMRTKKCLAVHTIDCHLIRDKNFLNLQWQRNVRTVKCSLLLRALDRPLLIQNITEVIYRHDCGLAEIQGKVVDYGRANIAIQVYVKSAVDLVELIMDLVNIRSVRRVELESTSLPLNVKKQIQRGPIDRHLINDLQREGYGKRDAMLLTPLTNAAQRYGEIILGYNDQKPTFSKDMFFGRQNEVKRLKSYLGGSVGGIALVTGPKRVGKTSLCLRFLDSVSESTQPYLIRVDLRGHRRSLSAAVFEDISDALCCKFHVPTVRDHSAKELIGLIEAALVASDSKHLVLILDELGGPLRSFADGVLGKELFEFINVVLDRELPLSILLVTPPEGFALMDRCDVWSILRSMPSISLGPLEQEDAREMITRPFSQFGVSFRPNALKKVLFLAGYYPYYIILLLKEILTILNSQQSKVYVTEADIELATKKLLRMDSVFNYLVREASRTPFAVNCLYALATSKRVSDDDVEYMTEKSASYVLEDKLFSLLAGDKDFSKSQAQQALEQLVEDKIMDKQQQVAKGIGYKFSIPLFHHWLQKQGMRESR